MVVRSMLNLEKIQILQYICHMSEKTTILIAEDEMALGKIVKESLESRNFSVELAEDGEKALRIYKENKPQVLVLYVMMPKKDGFSVAREVRRMDKNIPIIFLTAKSQTADVVEGFNLGCNDYLKKPFSMEELIVRINNLISRKIMGINTESKECSSILPVRIGNKTVLISINKISYIIASGYYAEIYTKEKKYLIRESLNNLIDTLDPKTFFRVHRSAIVNLKYVQEIVHSEYSEIDVRMRDNKLISVSKSQKRDFMDHIRVK